MNTSSKPSIQVQTIAWIAHRLARIRALPNPGMLFCCLNGYRDGGYEKRQTAVKGLIPVSHI
jgi:hypothetical protein